MGEARQKSKSFKSILASASRCIYCSNKPSAIEHMPPICLFEGRNRPSGLEFPSCKECNNGTKAADIVATFFSRINRFDDDSSFWRTGAGKTIIATLDRDAPGLREEVMDFSKGERTFARTAGGVLVPVVVIQPRSALLQVHLNVFSAKMGMALYAELVGTPMPLEGIVQFGWFLNTGLSDAQAEAMLSILPIRGELKQGKFSSRSQFAYRYNTDRRSIVAALVGLNSNLHIFVIACGALEKFHMPMALPHDPMASGRLRPGELVAHLRSVQPKRRLRIIQPLRS